MEDFWKLLQGERAGIIPADADWFAPLLGDWDFIHEDEPEPGKKRFLKGEWSFRRVLEGAGIEDVFICPSRAERDALALPDAEYGVALRVYDPERRCYNMVYTVLGGMVRLCFRQEGERLVGRLLVAPFERWGFSDIREDSFVWRKWIEEPDGGERVLAQIRARRRR